MPELIDVTGPDERLLASGGQQMLCRPMSLQGGG